MNAIATAVKAAPISLASLVTEKSVHGHVHIDELFLTYAPLKSALEQTYGASKERDFHSAEVKLEGVRARIYFRYFPLLRLLTLDWIYVPKALRRRQVGLLLLRKMSEHFPEARSVHLLLAHGNLRAFQADQHLGIEDKVNAAPTIRQLRKLGFQQIEFVGRISFPNDKLIYPEVLISKGDIPWSSLKPSSDVEVSANTPSGPFPKR